MGNPDSPTKGASPISASAIDVIDPKGESAVINEKGEQQQGVSEAKAKAGVVVGVRRSSRRKCNVSRSSYYGRYYETKNRIH
jgi:hypothetical protein